MEKASKLTRFFRCRLSVHNYNQLMKDFPLNDLLAATDLERIQEGTSLIFRHLSTKLKLSYV
jgi:dynein heavy chain 1